MRIISFTFILLITILLNQGIAAGLLNYFFRGQIEVSIAPGGIKIRNANQEAMTFYTDTVTGAPIGQITLYYDDTLDNRRPLATLDMTIDNPATPQDERILAPGGETPVITFPEPNDNIKKHRYIVVFHGQLGSEEGAVIGKITQPLQIYYVSKRNDIYKIYKMDTDGSNPTLVYDDQDPDTLIGKLSPSPDGKYLVFTAEKDPTDPLDQALYILDLTKGVDQIPAKLTSGDWLSWSPDGTRIVFQRETGQYLPGAGDVELFTIELNPDLTIKTETQLTNVSGSSYNGQPSWSPDGNSIAIGSDRDGDLDIWLIDQNGNYITNLTDSNSEMDGYPVFGWAP